MNAILIFLRCNKRNYFIAMALSLFVLPALGFAGIVHFTQEKGAMILSTGTTINAEWVLDKTVSNVDFYHAVSICNGKNVVLLKFVNRNSSSVKVSWKEIFITQSRERKEGFSGRKEMLIPTGTTTPTDCTDVINTKVIIRGAEVDPMTVVDIENFEYIDITVTQQ